MLKHEESDKAQQMEPQTASEAAQVRVTTKELADAMASLQARKEAAARRMEGSIPIGEAIQELQLDATPEELLAEVQTLRARVPPPSSLSRTGLRARLLAAFGAAAAFALGMGTLLFGVRQTATLTPPEPIMVSPPALSTLTISAPPETLVQDKNGATPILRTVGEVENGRPVLCSLSQTEAGGAFVNFSNPALAWTLIKHDGQMYVRGWMANRSRQAMATGDVEIFSHKADVPAASAPIAVTLRLARLRCLPGSGDDMSIVARAVQPDMHFREAW